MPVVLAITKSLGFDNFLYGTTASVRPSHEVTNHIFTTHPREWIRPDDEMANVEVDPRFLIARESATPLVWDQDPFRGRNKGSDVYLDDALRHGVGSSVCYYRRHLKQAGIAPRTVQFHLDAIRTKLGAANRQEAIARAVRNGIAQAGIRSTK